MKTQIFLEVCRLIKSCFVSAEFAVLIIASSHVRDVWGVLGMQKERGG